MEGTELEVNSQSLSPEAQKVIDDWFSNPAADTANMYHLEGRVFKHGGLNDPVWLEVVRFIDARNVGNQKYANREKWMVTVQKLDELAMEFMEITKDEEAHVQRYHPELVYRMDVEGQSFEIFGDLHDEIPELEPVVTIS